MIISEIGFDIKASKKSQDEREKQKRCKGEIDKTLYSKRKDNTREKRKMTKRMRERREREREKEGEREGEGERGRER